MQRPTTFVWISTAILAGVLQATVPTEALAQPPTLTRELDSPSRGDRYAERVTVLFPGNNHSASKTITPVIPAGKKLFLQSVSIHTLLTHGQNLMQTTVTINPGRTPLAHLYVDMDFQAAVVDGEVTGRQRHFTGNRDINMVLNAGESIAVGFFRNGDQGQIGANFSQVTLTGYFVDVDPLTPPSD